MHSDRSSGKLNRRARIQSLITGDGRDIRGHGEMGSEKGEKKIRRHQRRGVFLAVDTKYTGIPPNSTGYT